MEATATPDQSLASQFALRVALQTMKERCILLQKRLYAFEEENQKLRKRVQSEPHVLLTSNPGSAMENIQLQNQVADLKRQKSHLYERIDMVSIENRMLWSRLSQIAKDQSASNATFSEMATNASTMDNDCPPTTGTNVGSPRGNNTNQNLTRSKTFTQHSPNPNLRHKLIPSVNAVDEKDSLEEVVLVEYQKYDNNAPEEFALEVAGEAELGFAYFNVDSSASDSELNCEVKKCFEGFEELRREAVQQQHDLNVALSMLETKIGLSHCRECENPTKRPEMADKSLETDESLTEMRAHNYPSEEKTKHLNPLPSDGSNAYQSSLIPRSRVNIVQEKIKADETNNTCPMCGKLFSSEVPFDAFQEHVEAHFIDENDVEASLERNFEFVSHAVGDF